MGGGILPDLFIQIPKQLSMTFQSEPCSFPGHRTPAWCLVLGDLFLFLIFKFFFLKGVSNEIILTEFVLNWSHMWGVNFQTIEIRQATVY